MKTRLTLAAAVAAMLFFSPGASATELELAGEDDLLLVPGSVQQQGHVFTARAESANASYDYVIDQVAGVARWSSPSGSGAITLGNFAGQGALLPQKYVDSNGDERVEWAWVPIVGIAACILNHQAQIQSFMSQCFARGGMPDVSDSGICGYGAGFKCVMPCTPSTGQAGEHCDQAGAL